MTKSFTDKMGYESPFGESSSFNESSGIKSEPAIVKKGDKDVLAQINQEKQNEKPKEKINLLLVLDSECVDQFKDSKNNVWAIRHIDTFANLDFFKELIKNYSFKNVCLVHHGTVFSDHTLNKDNKVKLPSNLIKVIKELLLKSKEEVNIIDDAYISEIHEISKSYRVDGELGIKKIYLKSFFSLKLLIENILDGGSFLSVACKEVTDVDVNLVKELASFSKNNIKLFANSNYTIINSKFIESISSTKEIRYGCILNLFLTDSNDWENKNGWFYFDTQANKVFITQKDLWLYSNDKTRVYSLISRKKELTIEQIKKEKYAQRYFSKAYELYYLKYFGKEAYTKWVNGVEKTYPEFKG